MLKLKGGVLMNNMRREYIKVLRIRSASYDKIAKALGISINTIKSFCRVNNLTKVKTIANENPLAGAAYCQNCGQKLRIKLN